MVSSTARAWLVRPSYSVGSTPHTSSLRLVNRRTSCTVSSSCPTPRCDSVSHCSGISTPSRRGQRGDGVLIPLQCETLSHRGVGQLLDTVHDVRRFTNRKLEVWGVLPTLYDGRTNHARAVLENISETYELDVIEPPIPKSIRFAEAPAAGRSILPRPALQQGRPGLPRGRRCNLDRPARRRPRKARPATQEPKARARHDRRPQDDDLTPPPAGTGDSPRSGSRQRHRRRRARRRRGAAHHRGGRSRPEWGVAPRRSPCASAPLSALAQPGSHGDEPAARHHVPPAGHRAPASCSARAAAGLAGHAGRRRAPTYPSPAASTTTSTRHVRGVLPAAQAWAIDDSGTMRYFVRFAHGDNAAIGFHDIPVDAGPGRRRARPRRSRCIRQRRADAKALWRFARTAVVVTVNPLLPGRPVAC